MKTWTVLIALLTGLVTSLSAKNHAVADIVALHEAVNRAGPGDVIVMKDGIWHDAPLVFKANGKADQPITLKAETPGKVVLTGKSRLSIAGEHLVVQGLWFRDVTGSEESVIDFRGDSKSLSSHCQIENCAITMSESVSDGQKRPWVSLYGIKNTVKRCHFAGKKSAGTLLIVWLPKSEGPAPEHLIEHNYFGSRQVLGKNGGEIIRVGDSKTSMQSAKCLVVENYFEHCNGETECISNKSCDNIYRGNFFLECQGTLTLRHGNRCLVEGNTFIGSHLKETGGIRVIGEDHRVIGNHLDSLAGDGARAAICLMNGIQDSPANGYFQVKRALISDNVITDCKQSFCIGFADDDVKAPLAPVDCVISENQALADKYQIVHLLDAKASLKWEDNVFHGASSGLPSEPFAGVSWAKPEVEPAMPPVKREDVGVSWNPTKL
jgi:poly(beta-D-mannuronate) lyase